MDTNESQVKKPAENAPAEDTQPKRYNSERRDRPNTDDNRNMGREKKRYFRKKVCYFCKNGIDVIDYKDVKLLRRYMKESGKIIPKRLNGSCSKHQRVLAKAIKRSRNIALLPFETKY